MILQLEDKDETIIDTDKFSAFWKMTATVQGHGDGPQPLLMMQHASGIGQLVLRFESEKERDDAHDQIGYMLGAR